MRKVKIIRVYGERCYDCDHKIPLDDFSDWEEVSEEDYEWLKKWAQHNYDYMLYDDVTSQPFIQEKIKSIKVFVQKQKDNEERDRIARELKKTEAEKKRQQKELEKKQKMLEQLKAELGV